MLLTFSLWLMNCCFVRKQNGSQKKLPVVGRKRKVIGDEQVGFELVDVYLHTGIIITQTCYCGININNLSSVCIYCVHYFCKLFLYNNII